MRGVHAVEIGEASVVWTLGEIFRGRSSSSSSSSSVVVAVVVVVEAYMKDIVGVLVRMTTCQRLTGPIAYPNQALQHSSLNPETVG